MSTKHLDTKRAKGVARIALLMAAIASPGLAVADSATGHQLNPGVNPGDIIIQRRVEAAPINRVNRHSGPISSRVNARDGAVAVQQQLTGVSAISLTDERAAGIRSSVQSSMGSLHRTLGTDSQLVNGGASGGVNNRVTSSLGGGSRAGGGVAGRVTSATSGISGNIGRALSPLTGRD